MCRQSEVAHPGPTKREREKSKNPGVEERARGGKTNWQADMQGRQGLEREVLCCAPRQDRPFISLCLSL